MKFSLLLRIACVLTGVGVAHVCALAADLPSVTQPCRIQGIRNEVRCGVLSRALDPANPAGAKIDVHYVVVPALARNKKPDPLFFFAGGPGQGAITVAPAVLGALQRLNNWRDIVFIDQRGTGKSAALKCDDARDRTLTQTLDFEQLAARMSACMQNLQQQPHGKLAFYTTTIAMQDADAIRETLGYAHINLIGGSYGTRAALEYQRAFPQRVRRAVLDGIAPPDMVLPASFSLDAQSAFDALLAFCERDTRCQSHYPHLRRDWQTLSTSLPRAVSGINPITGKDEKFTLSHGMLASIVRGPLYAPQLASVLPFAITEASVGNFTPLLGAATALGSATNDMAWGMHFAVVCAEDFPRMGASRDVESADFGKQFSMFYTSMCALLPKSSVPAAFYAMPTAKTPMLLLSGGADPATPPRHGERAAKALGANAVHVVVPNAGHGIMGIGCMRDVIFRFFDAANDADALKVDASCATNIPRPFAWSPVKAKS